MSVGEGVPVALGDPVGCTVVVRRERSGTELLVLHRAVDGDAVWTTPSGCRRPGEPVYAAARRALREETGLGALDVWAVDLSRPRAVFAAEVPDDVVVDLRHSGHEGYAWLTPDEAAGRIHPEEARTHVARAAAVPAVRLAFRPLTRARCVRSPSGRIRWAASSGDSHA